jgi:hypothetical protein
MDLDVHTPYVNTPYANESVYAVYTKAHTPYVHARPYAVYTPHIRRMSMQNIRRMASLNEQQGPDFRVSVQEIKMQPG